MKHKSSLHRRFEEAKQQAAAQVIAHGEATTEQPPVQELPSVVTEDLDANVLATGPAAVVCIEPNPDNAKAAQDAYEELESKLNDRLGADLQSTTEGLALLRHEIAQTNLSGGFTPECAFFAAIAVEAHSDRLGFTDDTLTASFESAIASPEGKMSVSTEALDYTLEAVDEVGKHFGKKVAASFYRAMVPLWAMTKLSSARLDKVIEQASKMKGANKGGNIHVKSRLIAEGDHTSTDLAKGFAKAAEFLKYVMGPFAKQAKLDYSENMEVVFEKLTWAESLEDKVKAFDTIASGWKDPRSKLGDKASSPLIGNYQLFEDESLKYKGNNPALKKLDALANLNYPTMVGFQKAEGTASHAGSVDVKALSPDEIVKIGSAFKAAAGEFSAWRAYMETLSGVTSLAALFGPAAIFMLNPIWMVGWAAWSVIVTGKAMKRGNLEPKSGDSDAWMKDLRVVYDALNTSNRLRLHVSADAARVLNKITSNFVKIAKLSLKAHATASVESWDQATATDGVSVNETSPIEPTQEPGAHSQAPEGEVLPHQSTFQDQPAAKQDLNGTIESNGSPVEDVSQASAKVDTASDKDVVKEVLPATADTTQEVTNAKLSGEAPSGVTVPAAAEADKHADGSPVAAVEAPGQDTAQEVTDAALRAEAATGVDVPAAAHADNHADGKPVAAVDSATPDIDATVKDASLRAEPPKGMTATNQEPGVVADTKSDQPEKVVDAVQAPKSVHTVTVESRKAPPYWYRKVLKVG
jgi:hypothetical protein